MADVAVIAETDKRKRTRSPAYPFINLEVAISRAKQFYEKEARNAANVNIAAKHWGFVEGSSNGAQTAAALISFGLLQDEGTSEKRKIRLTQNALRILLDTRPESKERAELIKQAALAPKIHQQLWAKWHTDLPSDDQVKHTLLFDWETPFNERAIEPFIKEYRDTITFSGLVASDTVNLEEIDSDDGAESEYASDPKGHVQPVTRRPITRTPILTPEHQTSPLSVKKHMQEFVVPLSEGGRAVFQWPSSLSQEDVDDLKDSLKILERKISRSTSERSRTLRDADPIEG
jgi:hypothetical protein